MKFYPGTVAPRIFIDAILRARLMGVKLNSIGDPDIRIVPIFILEGP